MKSIIFLSLILSFFSASADVVMGESVFGCSVTYEKADGPIKGVYYEIVKEDQSGQLKLVASPNCPACIVVPTITDITKDEVVGTIKTYETQELTIEIYLESLLPTKTYPATVIYKEDGAEEIATCQYLD